MRVGVFGKFTAKLDYILLVNSIYSNSGDYQLQMNIYNYRIKIYQKDFQND